MILNCMIVDDDLLARKALSHLCKKMDNLNVVQVCESATVALEFLAEEEIDLIFLDIEMPELSGIDFLDRMVTMPQVVFTTSKTEYAFEAFEYEVTDYLKKPIKFPRFQKAVEKVVEVYQKNNDTTGNSNINANEVYLRENGKLIRVSYENIEYFENAGDYILVKTGEGKHIIHGTLKSIDAKLNHPLFLKVHRSFIVNLSKIKDIEENTLVIDKKVIPISRANKPVLLGKLNML